MRQSACNCLYRSPKRSRGSSGEQFWTDFVNKTIMDDEEFDPNCCLLVKIEPAITAEDQDMECLEMYMENLTDGEDMCFKFNRTRCRAIIKFNQPIDDVQKLQKKITGKPLCGYKITLETFPLEDRVLVTGLPPEKLCITGSLSDLELVLYFENKRFCPDGGDVTDLKVLPCGHGAVVQFESPDVVKKLKADHKLEDCQFTVRRLNIFEFVEQISCSQCNEDKYAGEDAEGTEPTSWHSPVEDDEATGSQKHDTESDSQSETDEDITKLESWQKSNEDAKTRSQDEHVSFTGEKSTPSKKLAEYDNAEVDELLLTTIKYQKISGLLPEDYDMIRISKSTFEITTTDKKKADHIKKAIEDAQGFSEVDLAAYTKAADKLNTSSGIKWIKELLRDLKIPAFLKKDRSTLMLRAAYQTLAEEAAKTVATSLLSAKIKCDRNQMKKCSSVLQDKTLTTLHSTSGNLELLGIPIDVIKAVGEIEQKLNDNRSWLTR